MSFSPRSLFLAAWLMTSVTAQLVLFNSTCFTGSKALPATCKTAMSANIACDPALLRYATSGYNGFLSAALLTNTLCSSICTSALASYRGNVAEKCSNVDAWPGFPATHTGDFLSAYQNQTCLKDSSGAWCVSK